jgi:hypothetical protein
VLPFVIIGSCVLAGLGVYAALEYSGALPALDHDAPRGRLLGGRGVSASRIPPGCVVSILVGMGVWILAWLVFLVIGLSVLVS